MSNSITRKKSATSQVPRCLLTLIFLLLGPGLTFVWANDLEAIIEADASLGSAGAITFIIHNRSEYPAKILTWYTPLEKQFNSNMFTIFKNGDNVQYTGRLVKRGRPKESDYITVEAGGSISESISLPDGYDITTVGSYETTYSGIIQYQLIGAKKRSSASSAKIIRQSKRSNKLLLEVTSPPEPKATYKQVPAYNSCIPAETASLELALTEAESLAIDAYDALSSIATATRDSAGRYGVWFGAYTSARYQTALDNFQNISSALSDETITFSCDCDEDYIAYVYPNLPYDIHLCNSFWGAGLIGTDSQAGSIIHEMSHFTKVAGTDDHIYGQTGAFELAQTNPANALDNADNLEYFAENSPSILKGPIQWSPSFNNTFSIAGQVTGANFYAIGDSTTATKETNEPVHGGNSGGSSIWLSWRAPATGNIQVNTIGTFDTLLGVYTGSVVNSLYTVASNDDFGSPNSQVNFNATAGQSYNIAVDGYDGASGTVLLLITTSFGDINGDDSLNLTDAILTLRLLSGQTLAQTFSLDGDVNEDNRIGLEDAVFILEQVSQ